MKTAKLLFVVAALGAMFSAPAPRAQAETENAPAAESRKAGRVARGSPEQQISAIDRAVGGLTEEQKTKITALLGKARDEARALPREERTTKRREIMTGQRDEIRALLTEEQKQKFDAQPQGTPRAGGAGKARKKKDR